MAPTETTTLRVPVRLRDEIARLAEARGSTMLDIVTDNTQRVVSHDPALGDPRVRAERLRQEFYGMSGVLHEEARAAGLEIHGTSTLGQTFSAACRLASMWERRAHRLERTLRHLLASDALNDEQRAEAIDVLFGRKQIGRDRKTLSPRETQLLEHYRGIDADGKQMLWTLIDRLAKGA